MSNASDPSFRPEGRLPFWAIGLLLALYALTRVGSLEVLPIFLDEAVHLQWAERLYAEGRILRPVGSGRLLAVAAYGLALPFDDRLFAARLMASAVGALTLVFTMLLAYRLFGSRAGVVAGTLYILSPFALVYDRLALSDGFLSASLTALMWSVWTLVQSPGAWSLRVKVAAFVPLAIVSKVSALFFLFTIPLGLLTLARDRTKHLLDLAMVTALGLLCASPMLWFFASSSGEISSQHFLDPSSGGSVIASTLLDMSGWIRSYFTPPALIMAGLSLILLRDGRAFWLFGSVVVPFLLFALFSQPWSARYVLPTLPPFLILISGGVDHLASRSRPSRRGLATVALTFLTSLATLSFDRALLFDPTEAPLPKDDRHQLVTGWPAGYGVRELSKRLIREADGSDVTVYVDTGGTRTVPTSLAILLSPHPEIRLLEGDFGSPAFRGLLAARVESQPTFAILGPRPADLDLASLLESVVVERLEAYVRPGGEWAATLFRLRGAPEATQGPVEGRVF